MAQSVAVPASIPIPLRIPLREVVPWAVFAGAILLTLLYVVGLDQGATSVFSGQLLHAFVHDGRHLLGVPCH
ncbi:CbtB-domain containing protein [soil metagenome]